MIERMTYIHTYAFSLDIRVRKHRIYTKKNDHGSNDENITNKSTMMI
jgi:hypothetical protein